MLATKVAIVQGEPRAVWLCFAGLMQSRLEFLSLTIAGAMGQHEAVTRPKAYRARRRPTGNRANTISRLRPGDTRLSNTAQSNLSARTVIYQGNRPG
jgi:hypothetical protein